MDKELAALTNRMKATVAFETASIGLNISARTVENRVIRSSENSSSSSQVEDGRYIDNLINTINKLADRDIVLAINGRELARAIEEDMSIEMGRAFKRYVRARAGT